MLRAFKTEIDPTEKQIETIRRTIGTCRFVHNFYLGENIRNHEHGKPFMTAYAFSKWMNNEYLPAHPEKSWIKDVSSKSVKHAICDAEAAYKKFFRKQAGFPQFRKKSRCGVKMYFVRNNPKDCICERHRIKIPTLGWVKLKEKGYIPTSKDGFTVKSGTVSERAGRYYVSVIIDMPEQPRIKYSGTPLGIDLGIKELAVCSDGTVFPNINKTERMRKLEKHMKREQRSLSKKYENLKHKKKGESVQKSNIRKQIRKIQKLYARMDDIRSDYINKTVAGIVKTKPSHITVEDLNVSGMRKNRHLAKAVSSQKLYEFRQKLEWKRHGYGFELRKADKWYASSKTCHACGFMKRNLKLSERTFRCPACGYILDRDLNAALNLRDTDCYTVVTA